MIKDDIIQEIVRRTGFPKSMAAQAVETALSAIKRALIAGERIEFRGFGIFDVRSRKSGVGRNPRTGVQAPIPRGKVIRFRPGKALQGLQ